MPHPTATYRVQLHAGFRLADLIEQLPYLQDLGVDTIYAAPLLAAQSGSRHGYNGTDPGRINPEIGSERDWAQLHTALRAAGMSWLQDIVPNHLALSPENVWLADVLRRGPDSRYAQHFDIDWEHPDFAGQLALPVLGHTQQEAIEAGHLRLGRDAEGTLQLFIYDRAWPLSDRSLPLIGEPREAEDFGVFLDRINRADHLSAVLAQQYYRPMHWQQADERINYRRFFTVNELICLRIDRPEVFDDYHAYLKKLLEQDQLQGLRIDHIDGLLDPATYLARLRQLAGPEVYLAVEKILEPGEQLPREWPIDGTTGYDYLAAVNRLLTSAESAAAFSALYRQLTREEARPYDRRVFDNKSYVLLQHFRGELANLVRHWQPVLPAAIAADRFSDTLAAWLAAFPVYRIYPAGGSLSATECQHCAEARDRARTYVPELREPLDRWHDWLVTQDWRGEGLSVLRKTQQLSGPLMAKGVEDTTFYRFWRQAQLNEVGSSADPQETLGVEDFHHFVQSRPATTMNATATHDTKRGEDARALLQGVSGLAEAWADFVDRAFTRIVDHHSSDDLPRAKDLYQLVQTLVATFPLDRNMAVADYPERLGAYLRKALREGKTISDWAQPNAAYESRLVAVAERLLRDAEFVLQLRDFQEQVLPVAYRCTLAQTALKCLLPGVPDIYQGSEAWDQSLVDPDNRRPVPYPTLTRRLARLRSAYAQDPLGTLLGATANLSQPDLKTLVLHRCLLLRREHPDFFRHADYRALHVNGPIPGQVLAFERHYEDRNLVVVIPGEPGFEAPWPTGSVWKNYVTHFRPGRYRHWLTQEENAWPSGGTGLEQLLAQFPVGVWWRVED
jgi:(1->4)-alpha-D-glucan 1-alpha-D-glucosylmutase